MCFAYTLVPCRSRCSAVRSRAHACSSTPFSTATPWPARHLARAVPSGLLPRRRQRFGERPVRPAVSARSVNNGPSLSERMRIKGLEHGDRVNLLERLFERAERRMQCFRVQCE